MSLRSCGPPFATFRGSWEGARACQSSEDRAARRDAAGTGRRCYRSSGIVIDAVWSTSRAREPCTVTAEVTAKCNCNAEGDVRILALAIAVAVSLTSVVG